MKTIHLLLPITHYRPEEIRVVTHDVGHERFYCVEFYIPKQKAWVVQKEYKLLDDAMQDAIGWYCKLDYSFKPSDIQQIYWGNRASFQIIDIQDNLL